MEQPRFSQRIGKTPMRVELQVESMDDDLRNAIWNYIYSAYLKQPDHDDVFGSSPTDLYRHIWANHYKKPLHKLNTIDTIAFEQLQKLYSSSEWDAVYSLVEFLAQLGGKEFAENINPILEREMSGYRLIGNQVTAITDPLEIDAIEKAIKKAQHSPYSGAHQHLQNALAKLSDRKAPDYRNSIKESISSVESIASRIAGKDKAELASALDKLGKHIDLHPALKEGFKKLYHYTCDEDGVRHAIMDDDAECDFADAKYMLVTCSAFVNYLIIKSSQCSRSVS